MNAIFEFLSKNEKFLFILLLIITAFLCLVLPAIVIPNLNPIPENILLP
ncbi:hypothetical protein ACFL4G_10730 [Thermodesulfobacteriota bacterium]